MIEAPQSFVIRQECDKIAFQNGFRRTHGETDGWRRYSSTTAQGSIWLAAEHTGTWLLSSIMLACWQRSGLRFLMPTAQASRGFASHR
jgi:hypothetical protein